MDREQQLDEVITAYLKACEASQQPDPADWMARHPDLADDLREFLAGQGSLDRLAAPLRQQLPPAAADKAGENTLAVPEPAAAPLCRWKPSATSATTNCSKRSPVAAWASSTARARSVSTGPWRSR